MNSKLREVMNAVYNKRNSILSNSDMYTEVDLAIYMESDYYRQCQAFISGEVSPLEYELCQSQTIFGFPVYMTHKTSRGKTPPPWVIVNLKE